MMQILTVRVDHTYRWTSTQYRRGTAPNIISPYLVDWKLFAVKYVVSPPIR